MKNQFTLGVDLAKDSFVASLIDRQGNIILPVTTFNNNAKGCSDLHAAIPEPQHTKVIFESTGVYGKRFVQNLSATTLQLFEVNPLIIKRLSTSMVQTKTDQADAACIARVGKLLAESDPETLQKYRVKHNPDRENLALWVAEYKRLSDASSRLKQQIKNLAFHAAPEAHVILGRREQELQQLKQQLKSTKQEIEALLKHQADEEAQCLSSITGVGTLTTATALVSIQNIDRFPTADSLKAYWGMYPRRRQSGKYEARSRMANHGNKLMRHMLWNAAKSAARHNKVCRELYERLIARGKKAPAAYGAVARKLVQIIYGVLKSKTKFDPNLNCS
jgi:transposase